MKQIYLVRFLFYLVLNNVFFNCSIASGLTDYCRALYDYDATGSDEITFEEGDIIRVLKREPNGVDDGWWMGELRTGANAGTSGLFPSIVVEECYENGEDSPDDYSLASPQSSVAPPSFSPPRVPSAMIPGESKQVNLFFSVSSTLKCAALMLIV